MELSLARGDGIPPSNPHEEKPKCSWTGEDIMIPDPSHWGGWRLVQRGFISSLVLRRLVQALIHGVNPRATITESAFYGPEEFNVSVNKNIYGEPATRSEDPVFCLEIRGYGVKEWPSGMQYIRMNGILSVSRTCLQKICLSGWCGCLNLNWNDNLMTCTLDALYVGGNTFIESNKNLSGIHGTFQSLGDSSNPRSIYLRLNKFEHVPDVIQTAKKGTLVYLWGNKIDPESSTTSWSIYRLSDKGIDVSLNPNDTE